MKGLSVTWGDNKLVAWIDAYHNGQIRIDLTEDGMQYCTATCLIPEFELAEGYAFIKDWSENKGVLQALIDAGIVEDTGKRVPTGYVEAAIVKLV